MFCSPLSFQVLSLSFNHLAQFISRRDGRKKKIHTSVVTLPGNPGITGNHKMLFTVSFSCSSKRTLENLLQEHSTRVLNKAHQLASEIIFRNMQRLDYAFKQFSIGWTADWVILHLIHLKTSLYCRRLPLLNGI